eukprot:gnl/TRDRNA2_/TRDRNA2_189865_c0_seq1.p1 gnl/TRDRNA2_/TRDRNA2_189865_c0~~gnl/TRDRNA2_/TRDRNA2_189865_c0_seq1.p1  ORF type:complete len:276 (+),score=54.27 gnl/TRDRNA2_/TRDRNA2_189865_c0_seq1:87-830(+)
MEASPGEASSGRGAAEAAALLLDLDAAAIQDLTPEKQKQLDKISALLSETGWKRGRSRGGVSVNYKYSDELGLYFVCSCCDVPDTARSMWEDFNKGNAQQRYNEACSAEELLLSTEKQPPLGHERLVRGIYKLPTPLSDRDFIWNEWSALLPTNAGGELYVSVACTPNEKENNTIPPYDGYVRGHLEIAATLARQEPGESEVQAASIIMGDIRGNMPKNLQNLIAGNASTYLKNFRDAHAAKPAAPA